MYYLKILVLIGIAVLLIGFVVSFTLAWWHFGGMTRGAKNRWILGATGPLGLLFPRLFTEAGINHRAKFALYITISLGLGGILLVIQRTLFP